MKKELSQHSSFLSVGQAAGAGATNDALKENVRYPDESKATLFLDRKKGLGWRKMLIFA
ncbi:hypothetical protein M3090_04515 [Bacteroides sp. ET71]|uniref:hypothetical protein n=1 Tax=Bacteroides sp. ET71 TaxID=2939421 RepID=UPI00201355E1|nr:hypothetical protein [Bacteroides sp. ET71]MCL1615656.1 hypothetical protein [Bacteroides sp. ET71]